MIRSQEGSSAALEELLRRWRPRLWIHAVHVVGNEDAAQDVIQEALVGIAQGIRRLDDPSRFRSWAYQIVTYKGRDWIRKQQRNRRLREEVASEREVTSQEGPSTEAVTDVAEALQRVSSEHRDLLRLFYHLGLTVREISELQEVPEGTVKSRLHAARAELLTHFESK
ncbi:MAG: RNA polymerase sigma factor [Verrucomicrobiota bacterium]